MSVHYKFKSALDFDTITFDGLHISVNDLKKAITHQKRLGKTSDFDLQITNAQTKEEYCESNKLIPKNTSLIIARVPLAIQPKKPWDPQAEKVQIHRSIPEPERGDLDLSQMNGSEEDKIQAMMLQSTMDYDPNKYQKLRGQGQTGEVPPSYRCFKCHKPGHWIKNCPLNTSGDFDHKRNTGIPRSFLQEREAAEKDTPAQAPAAEKKHEIPEDLICAICKDLFTDAVMIPCCGSSFCDECVRTALLESEHNECPDCNEKGSSPGSLIPNRFLRNSVNAFKNETGYNKPQKRKEALKIKDPANEAAVEAETKPESDEIVPVAAEEPAPEELPENVESVSQKDLKQEAVDKKTDPHSSHDEVESDFEDNITVTVPPPFLPAPRSTYQDRSYNGRHSRHPRPPGMENSPHHLQTSPPQEHEPRNQHPDEMVSSTAERIDHHHSQHISSNISVQREPNAGIRIHRSTPSDMYGNPTVITTYPQNIPGPLVVPGPLPIRHYHMPNYGIPNPAYGQYNMNERMRGPYPMTRPGFHGPMSQMRPRHMMPSNNLESVYQGVAAKVGTGIIDDPLEAFNRIMREKEKRKEERRRSPDRRRSRSIEMRNRRHSPGPHQRMRQRTPDDRRGRSPPRRGRSRNRDKRISDMDKRKHRSSSFSDRSSRSRSWSNIQRRRSKSPLGMRKRSRTRSPAFNQSRSRSRSNSQGRLRGPIMAPMRYNRSPLRSISPRYRPKDTRNSRRDDFRENSPYHGGRRPRSRGRSPVNQYNRQDRPISSNQEHYNYHHQQPAMLYNEPSFARYNKRFSRERQTNLKITDKYSRERSLDFKGPERYDEAPPGTVEPPPPGFEVSPQQDRGAWNHNAFDDHNNAYRNDFRKIIPENNKNFKDRIMTPDLQDRDAQESGGGGGGGPRESHRHHDNRHRDGRSWSRSSIHSSNANVRGAVDRKRRSRTRSPVRLAENSHGQAPGRDFPLGKERYKDRNSSADHYYHGNDKINNDKIEVGGGGGGGGGDLDKKRDRGIDRATDRGIDRGTDRGRDKKSTTDYSKDSSSRRIGNERKLTDKEDRPGISKDKEKDKEKDRSKEHDKEKRKELSEVEDDKKDKKIKDRKKKKKDKEEKEAKKKIKKKEKKDKAKLKDTKDNLHAENVSGGIEKSKEEICKENTPEDDFVLTTETTSTATTTNSPIAEECIGSASMNIEKDFNAIDLYGDICEDDIKYDYMKNPEDNITDDAEDKNLSSVSEMKRYSSVLELNPDHDDLDQSDFGIKKGDEVHAPLPEPSKWELDDDAQNGTIDKSGMLTDDESDVMLDKSGKVTSEVLKRAENAIFKRAINAIRPSIEIKTISVERQKLYSNEHNKHDLSPLSVSCMVKTKLDDIEHHTFQITVPVSSSSNDRSVELKPDKSHKQTTPALSVKDRLGPVLVRHSESNSPHINQIELIRNEKTASSSNRRSRSHERNSSRDSRRGSIIKRPTEQKRFKEMADNSRDRYRNNRGNGGQQNLESENNYQNKRKLNLDRSRERHGGGGGGGDGDFPRNKNYNKGPPMEGGHKNFKDQSRDRFGGRDMARERMEQRSNSRNTNIDPKRSKDINDHHKRQRSDSSDRRDKRLKREKEEKEKNKNSENKQNNNEDKTPKNEQNRSSRSNEGQKIQQNEAAAKQPQLEKTNENEKNEMSTPKPESSSEKPRNEKTATKRTGEKSSKTATESVVKKSRSPSAAAASTSSSSSSDSGSGSESEDRKKKKRKHKKEKKRTKRSSSVGSNGSTSKRKRSKSKKKNKSSKKKKKNKK